MTRDFRTTTQFKASELATNKVLRNTYLLLGLTVMFSALVAFVTMINNVAPPNIFLTLIGMFGLSYLTSANQNSSMGLVCIFAFTGFMGYVLGPILNMYLHSFSNGYELVTTALGATGIIFLSLSAYAVTSRENFSYMGGFLFAAVTVAFIVGLGAAIFQMPMLHLIVSGAFALISAGLVLFHTSAIIHGSQTNYIEATISIYMALFNLFLSLLRILSAFAGNRD
ncbi:MAG: Bax inhibitor-1/YccA family protein [Legionellales bacterium]|jgi:modulator of FtsH protease|nr:Bax inhibitor-1/YccA family protein [Legionellales bacterium]